MLCLENTRAGQEQFLSLVLHCFGAVQYVLAGISLRPGIHFCNDWRILEKQPPDMPCGHVVTLSRANPSDSLCVNAVNLLPSCITAGLFYEETLTPFPGDKSRLSLQEMVNPRWVPKQFKPLTLVGEAN